MSNYTSSPPPPYTLTPQTLHHGHAHSTPQARTLGCEGQFHGHEPRPFHSHLHGPGHGHGRVNQPSIHITVPTSPASHTIIHHGLNRYRYNETYPFLWTGRQKHNSPRRCLFATLGAVLILVVFATIFRIMSADNEFAWTNFESSSCTSYATREYVAELNVSVWNIHRMEICMTTSADVHGRPHRPSHCEVRSGKVVGHFVINHDEPDCVTYWSEYKDKGCDARGSKKRHIAQHLMNLPHRVDYKEFCATTPARFLEREFSGADSCETSIWGIWGHWFIDDDSC